jgi:hypothetical protein
MPVDAERRYLCAELVTLRFRPESGRHREIGAHLEEISRSGASLLTETAIKEKTDVTIRCAGCDLAGVVCHAARLDHLGHCIGVRFHAGHEWSPALYQPEHLLLGPEEAGFAAPAGLPCNCCMAACPAVAYRPPQDETSAEPLRRLAHAVAGNCPGLDCSGLETCSHRLLGQAETVHTMDFRRLYREIVAQDTRRKARTKRASAR